MKLKQWMKQNKVTPLALSKKIKAAKWTLNRYLGSDRVPAPRIVVAIFKATNGAVQPNDFYKLPKVS